MYSSADELIDQHWRVNCKGFELNCDRCDALLTADHDCVAGYLAKKKDLANQIKALKAEMIEEEEKEEEKVEEVDDPNPNCATMRRLLNNIPPDFTCLC